MIFWFYIATKPYRQAFLVQFVTSTWFFSVVSISMGGELVACPQKQTNKHTDKQNSQITNPLSFGIYLFIWQTFTGVRKMRKAPSISPGSSHSDRGRLTHKQAVTKPSGKCLAVDVGGTEKVH